MKRRGRFSGGNPHQLQLDWHAAEIPSPAVPAEPEGLAEKPPTPLPVTIDPPPVAPARRRHRNGIVARLPVPPPLPVAVAAGRFGYDEDGQVIHPAPDEVRAITENQADKLIGMLDAMTEAVGDPVEENRIGDAIRALIAAYAQDFGERPAQQLEAFARRQALLEESSRDDRGWRR